MKCNTTPTCGATPTLTILNPSFFCSLLFCCITVDFATVVVLAENDHSEGYCDERALIYASIGYMEVDAAQLSAANDTEAVKQEAASIRHRPYLADAKNSLNKYRAAVEADDSKVPFDHWYLFACGMYERRSGLGAARNKRLQSTLGAQLASRDL